MKISILVITYNHEKYIKKCIDSILNQKGIFDFEILVGNDKSPDKTEKILSEYSKNNKIKIYNREKNIGPTKNLLDLYKKATGKYIALLEGDDFWVDESKLEKQISILEKYPELSLCMTESLMVDENNEIIGEKKIKYEKIKTLEELFLVRGGIPTGTCVFKNYFKNSINNSVENLLISGWMIGDLSLFAYLIKKGNFFNLKEKTSAYRYISNEGTSYSAMDNYKKNLELSKVIKGILNYTNDINEKKFLNFYLKRIQLDLVKENKKYKEELTQEEIIEINIMKLLKWYFQLKYSILKKRIRRNIDGR